MRRQVNTTFIQIIPNETIFIIHRFYIMMKFKQNIRPNLVYGSPFTLLTCVIVRSFVFRPFWVAEVSWGKLQSFPYACSAEKTKTAISNCSFFVGGGWLFAQTKCLVLLCHQRCWRHSEIPLRTNFQEQKRFMAKWNIKIGMDVVDNEVLKRVEGRTSVFKIHKYYDLKLCGLKF